MLVILLLVSCILSAIAGAYYWFVMRKECDEGYIWDEDIGKCKLGCAENEENIGEVCKRRYVTCQIIKITAAKISDRYLAVRGIEVYDEKGNNVALNKTVTMSSQYGENPGSNAVDGNLATIAHTDITSGEDEWIQIDLGSEHKVTKINILRQIGQNWGIRINNAKVELKAADGTVVHTARAPYRNLASAKPNDAWIYIDETESPEKPATCELKIPSCNSTEEHAAWYKLWNNDVFDKFTPDNYGMGLVDYQSSTTKEKCERRNTDYASYCGVPVDQVEMKFIPAPNA